MNGKSFGNWAGKGMVALMLMILFTTGAEQATASDLPEIDRQYNATVKKEAGLIGYWPLSKTVRAEKGSLELTSSRSELKTVQGPFGGSAIDLKDGNDLVIPPNPALDARELSIEVLFQVERKGNACLFGIRDKKATRFSLHYETDNKKLRVWNGQAVLYFNTAHVLSVNEWNHMVLSYKDKQLVIWMNGKRCEPVGNPGSVVMNQNLPFVLGASAPGEQNEHAAVAVAHLALYSKMLTDEQVRSHIDAAGWSKRKWKKLSWRDSPVSILESQIGYEPRNVKRVYLRSLQENPPKEILGDDFEVVDAKTEKTVFEGKVSRWGKKWESFWWVLDFTPLRAPGEYYVKTGPLVSSKFKVEANIFSKTDLDVIALNQLEHRIYDPDANQRGMKGKYVNCPPGVRIYRDCGSPYAELEPVGTCVYALCDMYDLIGNRFSETDRKRMIDLAALGADYIATAQRHTDDPETDGMFYHSLLVNTHDTWAGEIFTYLDTAYGMAVMARAHQFFEKKDPQRAARYLDVAKRAWKLCVTRPYHTKADRTIPKGCNAYFWNAPAGIQDTFGRCLYNILDKDWKMPMELRTRDRLPFVQGSALIYKITGDRKYLNKAIEFADAIMERQFMDWEHPIDGCFGTFYEFKGNDIAFFHEFMQGGFWWEGNVEAMNLAGFMSLLQLDPMNAKAAAWENTIRTYTENYARKSTTVNPLGIYPVACYRDPEHGGLKNFQNMLMGSSCLYGFSAKNFLRLGDFLQDASLQTNAMASVNFIAGLNPGVPNAYKDTAWDARSLIEGVGQSSFGPAGDIAPTARGSVPNGFCAAPQFWLPDFKNFIADQADKPAGLINQGGGLQFNEGWILHSHAYVQAVANLDAPYTLNLQTLDGGVAAPAEVTVELKEVAAPHTAHKSTYRTEANGQLTIADLPTPCEGTVRITRGGRTLVRPVAAISGGHHSLVMDFSRDVEVSIHAPALVKAGEKGEARIAVKNVGSKKVELKLVLSASGVALDQAEWTVSLKPGQKKKMDVGFTAGNKVMPYLLRALVAEGSPMRRFYSTGRIASAKK